MSLPYPCQYYPLDTCWPGFLTSPEQTCEKSGLKGIFRAKRRISGEPASAQGASFGIAKRRFAQEQTFIKKGFRPEDPCWPQFLPNSPVESLGEIAAKATPRETPGDAHRHPSKHGNRVRLNASPKAHGIRTTS
jgi:hypothetical protein